MAGMDPIKGASHQAVLVHDPGMVGTELEGYGRCAPGRNGLHHHDGSGS